MSVRPGAVADMPEALLHGVRQGEMNRTAQAGVAPAHPLYGAFHLNDSRPGPGLPGASSPRTRGP